MRRWCIPLLVAPALAGLLTACVSLLDTGTRGEPAGEPPPVPKRLPVEATASAYVEMVQEAREWREKAAAVGGEWRDVEPLLQQAAQAAGQGDYARAIELAESARFQAEMGYWQREVQEEVPVPPYLGH